MDKVDVAIVGAGPVGAALAALLVPGGRSVRVLEARSAPSRDARTLALSQASRELLEEAGGWPATGVTPIIDIHVSQKGGPGRALITAAEQGLAALGYTVSYAALEEALEARLTALGTSVSWGAPCEAIDLDAEHARLRLANGESVVARLLVLADGGANARRIPGLAYSEKDYGQVAITGPVHTDKPHRGRAYERFTPQGPVALLPVAERYALVWTATPDEAARILALDDAAFLAQLQAHFGDRAGRFVAVGPRASFPLKLRTINSTIALRTVIAGNAAQAMHPIAGQGLNIGLRDAASLASILAADPAGDPGTPAALEAYRRSRGRDAGRGVAFTDFLVGAFMDERRLPTLGRGLGLTVLDLLPPARRWLAGRMIHGAPAP
ncbi:MAG TPA: FAD-dependent monooxygenase [Usitatibacteraceae bacterium]|nr:FAD-dependent monooxygenase [Usitatibacteraceae bacterium]